MRFTHDINYGTIKVVLQNTILVPNCIHIYILKKVYIIHYFYKHPWCTAKQTILCSLLSLIPHYTKWSHLLRGVLLNPGRYIYKVTCFVSYHSMILSISCMNIISTFHHKLRLRLCFWYKDNLVTNKLFKCRLCSGGYPWLFKSPNLTCSRSMINVAFSDTPIGCSLQNLDDGLSVSTH